MYNIYFCFFLLLTIQTSSCQKEITKSEPETLKIGAERMEKYKTELEGKSIVVTANKTSIVGRTHLVDTLLNLNLDIKKIFAPEHGFRGDADAGEYVKDGKDVKTGLDIISLYGKNKKPQAELLNDIDVIVFDIQDVGVRCYTYISTLFYIMEVAAELDIEVLVLDRPNPHAHYVDGPLLEKGFESFVGLHNVPLIYGMTIGEYAKMINGEGWIKDGKKCKLTVIPCENYTRDVMYNLNIPPSPNLPNQRSIMLYPSLVLFEGTNVMVGRGTDLQFQMAAHPKVENYKEFKITPKPNLGAKYPKHQDQVCYGVSYEDMQPDSIFRQAQLSLEPLLEFHNLLTLEDEVFFLENLFFDKLAGTDKLRNQIMNNQTEKEIRKSWQKDILAFKMIREKYLLYP